MELDAARPEDSMKRLIELGTQGFFPLFHSSWIEELDISNKKFQKFTGVERTKAKKLFQKLSQHRTLEHKKIALLAMTIDDRKLFIKAFFKMVEGKIIDQRPDLH